MTYNIDLNVVVTAAATLGGTLLGGIVTLITTRRENRQAGLIERNMLLSRDLARASEQVAAYHALEGEYAGDIAAQRNIAARTVKTEYRNRVESLGFSRPKWTIDDARETLENALDDAQG